jgi:hypothetical protein
LFSSKSDETTDASTVKNSKSAKDLGGEDGGLKIEMAQKHHQPPRLAQPHPQSSIFHSHLKELDPVGASDQPACDDYRSLLAIYRSCSRRAEENHVTETSAKRGWHVASGANSELRRNKNLETCRWSPEIFLMSKFVAAPGREPEISAPRQLYHRQIWTRPIGTRTDFRLV